MLVTGKRLLQCLLPTVVFLTVGCPPPVINLPRPACPNVPSVQTPPNFGPQAPHVGKASFVLEFTSEYVAALMKTTGGLPVSSACGGTTCGADHYCPVVAFSYRRNCL